MSQALLGHPGGFSSSTFGGGIVALGATSGGAATASLPLQLPIMGLGSKSYPVLTPRFAHKHSHNLSAGGVPDGSFERGDSPPNPTTIVSLCAWYASASADISAEGAILAGSLTEVRAFVFG